MERVEVVSNSALDDWMAAARDSYEGPSSTTRTEPIQGGGQPKGKGRIGLGVQSNDDIINKEDNPFINSNTFKSNPKKQKRDLYPSSSRTEEEESKIELMKSTQKPKQWKPTLRTAPPPPRVLEKIKINREKEEANTTEKVQEETKKPEKVKEKANNTEKDKGEVKQEGEKPKKKKRKNKNRMEKRKQAQLEKQLAQTENQQTQIEQTENQQTQIEQTENQQAHADNQQAQIENEGQAQTENEGQAQTNNQQIQIENQEKEHQNEKKLISKTNSIPSNETQKRKREATDIVETESKGDTQEKNEGEAKDQPENKKQKKKKQKKQKKQKKKDKKPYQIAAKVHDNPVIRQESHVELHAS